MFCLYYTRPINILFFYLLIFLRLYSSFKNLFISFIIMNCLVSQKDYKNVVITVHHKCVQVGAAPSLGNFCTVTIAHMH